MELNWQDHKAAAVENGYVVHGCYEEYYDGNEKSSLLGESGKKQHQYRTKGKQEYSDNGRRQETPTPAIKIYRSRFWIASLASFLCWLHTLQWSMWGPISESMNAAFPGWDPGTVALMVNWGTIMYVICVIPLCWAMQRYGLRAGEIMSAALMAGGTALRCITMETPAFTILCHICAILVGGASALALSSPVVLANDWFPQHERSTAIGVVFGFSQLGSVGSYLEPMFIPRPAQGVTLAEIREDVMDLVYAGAIMSAVLLVALVIYFPSKPPTPPSISSTTKRIEFIPGLASVFKNKKFLALVVSYGVFVGPPIAWITVLDFSLLPLGFHQEKAMWVGVTAVIVSSISPVIVGRINDLIQGHIKLLLITLMLATTACSYWFLLLSYGIIRVTDWQVYASVIGITAFSYGSMPLFFEVGVDLAFPTSDILVTGIMTALDCLCSTMFLSIYSIPNTGYLWITYTLTFTSSLTIIPLLFLEFSYARNKIDTGTAHPDT